MVVKKQHYYPRALLKHFANDDDKFYVYMRLAKDDPIKYMNYEKVCSANHTYEGRSKDNKLEIDNILEKKLSSLESKLNTIIEKIIETIKIPWRGRPTVDINKEDIEFLFTYMYIQFIRTDRGRINFVQSLENMNYTPRKYPIELEEIKNSKNEIIKFNNFFRQAGNFEKLLKALKKPKNMNFHIAIGDFITSDNPVVATDNWRQIYMPISNNLCLEFQDDSCNCSDKIIVYMAIRKQKYINEAQIETANYCVISKKKFNICTRRYIRRRFTDPNWSKKSRHFK